MKLLKYLQAQGLGSRKQCCGLIRQERIAINGSLMHDPEAEIDPGAVGSLNIDGAPALVIPLPHYCILMHKPAGYETSHKPQAYPSVFSLLPDRLRATGIQAVGRLDADTTGVLLFTNDGRFNHRMTAPKHQTAKCYRATLKHPADTALCQSLLQGVLLHDGNETVRAVEARLEPPSCLLLTITEGKYHQVKRMIAAAGNRVTALHRLRFADWDCAGLNAGEWRFVAFPRAGGKA